MKDARLLIPVRGTRRKFYLVPPSPERHRPDYYVRFEVPAAARGFHHELPAVVYRSTQSALLPIAKERAREIIESVLHGAWNKAWKPVLAAVEQTKETDDILRRLRAAERQVIELRARINATNHPRFLPDLLAPIADKLVRVAFCESPAIYFLLKAGRVVYVGQSQNLFLRISGHASRALFDEILFLPTELADLNAAERHFIALLSPALNRTTGIHTPANPYQRRNRKDVVSVPLAS